MVCWNLLRWMVNTAGGVNTRSCLDALLYTVVLLGLGSSPASPPSVPVSAAPASDEEPPLPSTRRRRLWSLVHRSHAHLLLPTKTIENVRLVYKSLLYQLTFALICISCFATINCTISEKDDDDLTSEQLCCSFAMKIDIETLNYQEIAWNSLRVYPLLRLLIPLTYKTYWTYSLRYQLWIQSE